VTARATGDGFVFTVAFGDGWYRLIAWDRADQRLDTVCRDRRHHRTHPHRALFAASTVISGATPPFPLGLLGVLALQVEGGEGRGHGRMVGDRGGDGFAADEAGADELVGVAAVGLGTRRASRAGPTAVPSPKGWDNGEREVQARKWCSEVFAGRRSTTGVSRNASEGLP
jgi:hypothetical protein